MKQPAKPMILLAVILMDLLAGMEFDLFVPSFPELQSDFNVSPFWVEASLSINFIGYCISLFFVGALADHIGRKPIILLGLIAFCIGSVFCIFAPSYFFFLSGRFLQGIGIAAPAILSFLIIADSYPLKEQQFWMAMLNGSMNTAIAAAPVIGSYITLYFDWQGNFVALLALGLVVLIISHLFLPHSKLPRKKEKVSFLGYVPIVKSNSLMLLIMHLIIMFAPYWIFVGISPLLYMESLGVELSHFGFYQGVLALVFAVGSVLYGFIMHSLEHKKMLTIAMVIFMSSLILISYAVFTHSTSPLLITLALMLFVIGQIIPTTILYPLALNFKPEVKGKVSAMIQGLRLILSSLSLQMVGYFYDGTFYNVGIVLIGFAIMTIVTLVWVMKREELMSHLAEV
jgi:DHA1 family bicyclomycin/chloramphenicol resistance-like MFS transporter